MDSGTRIYPVQLFLGYVHLGPPLWPQMDKSGVRLEVIEQLAEPCAEVDGGAHDNAPQSSRKPKKQIQRDRME